MKPFLTICLFFIAFNLKAQYTLTTFNKISGYIEIHDQAYFDRMDNISQQLYQEHMEYYNKAVDYYNNKNFESAYFYFNKAFRQNYFSKVKITVDNDIFQNKALYAFRSILRIPHAKKGDVRNAWQLVDDVCDPERREIAEMEYKQWKAKKII